MNITTKFTPDIAMKYVAILIALVMAWMVVTLNGDKHFAALADQGALVHLVTIIGGWVGLCAVHLYTTGDPSPVVPPLPAAREPIPVRVVGGPTSTLTYATVPYVQVLEPVDVRPNDVPAPPVGVA